MRSQSNAGCDAVNAIAHTRLCACCKHVCAFVQTARGGGRHLYVRRKLDCTAHVIYLHFSKEDLTVYHVRLHVAVHRSIWV